ncbi:Hexose carrier protein [Nymphaea thermarum]|nr:Hexose carrier protein [Nymphaea thermarum]
MSEENGGPYREDIPTRGRIQIIQTSASPNLGTIEFQYEALNSCASSSSRCLIHCHSLLPLPHPLFNPLVVSCSLQPSLSFSICFNPLVVSRFDDDSSCISPKGKGVLSNLIKFLLIPLFLKPFQTFTQILASSSSPKKPSSATSAEIGDFRGSDSVGFTPATPEKVNAVGAIMAEKLGDHGALSKADSYLVLVLIGIYVSGFGISWGPLGWLVPSEIYPLEIRSASQSITVAMSFTFTFLISQTFLAML